MRVMIIDDEYSYSEKIHKSLFNELCKDFDNVIYDLYHHPKDIDYNVEYDLAFIDIDLPDKNGIMIAEEMKARYLKTKLVFVSSHTSLVHNTLIVNPFYFVRKSFYDEDINVLLKLISNKSNSTKIIELQYDDEQTFVFIKDIIYIESESHKLKVWTKERVYYDNRTLVNILNELCIYGFVRIHRSYVINLEYMTKIKGENVEMNHLLWLKIGRFYKDEFMKAYREMLLK